MTLLAGGGSAQLVRAIGTAGPVEGFRADGELAGARLSSPLPFSAFLQAQDGVAQVTQVVAPPPGEVTQTSRFDNVNAFFGGKVFGPGATGVIRQTSRFDNASTIYGGKVFGPGASGVIRQTSRFDNVNTFFGGSVGAGPVFAEASLASSGSSAAALASTRVATASVASSGASGVNLPAFRVANAAISIGGVATASLVDDSTYPAVEPERFIEVLGAELLHFEIVGEFKGPNYSEADLTASSLASLVIGTARVRPTLHASAGSGAAALSARAIGTTGMASAGSAATTLNALVQVLADGALSLSGFSGTSLTGLGIARFIEAQDMERGAEFRSMERGSFDASMALSAETRMERGEERRSMEVAS